MSLTEVLGDTELTGRDITDCLNNRPERTTRGFAEPALSESQMKNKSWNKPEYKKQKLHGEENKHAVCGKTLIRGKSKEGGDEQSNAVHPNEHF